MKILQIFGVVVAIHLLAFIFIFASPGCQSGPRAVPTPDSTAASAPAALTGPSQAAPDLEGSSGVTYTPVTAAGRAAPTRPGSPNAVAIAPPQPVAAKVEPVSTYTVERGDSLWSIAKKNRITVAELASANHLTTNTVLHPGRKLIIPAKPAAAGQADVMAGGAAAGRTYVVQPGDTLAAIAMKHGVEIADLRAANNRTSDIVRVGETLKLPEGAKAPTVISDTSSRSGVATTHVVQSGETLGEIARRYHVTVGEVAAANNITDPALIRTGQKLTIPGAKGVARTPAPASPPASAPPPLPGASDTTPAPAPSQPPADDGVVKFELKAPPPGVDLDAGLKGTTTEVPTVQVEEEPPKK